MSSIVELVEKGLPVAMALKDSSAVETFLVVIMCLAHLKMILRQWEQMLLQPGPLKRAKSRR